MPRRDGSRGQFNNRPYVSAVANLELYATSGTTNATGAITLDISAAGFSTVYAAAPAVIRNTADPTLATFAMVRSVSPTSVSIQCFESNTITTLLLGAGEGLTVTSGAVVVSLMVLGTS